MGEGTFKQNFETNDGEIEKTAEEALEVLRSYPKSVTEQPKIDDGSIEIPEKEVKPEDLKEAMDKATKAIENQDQKLA
jgi:hypothetical protein